MRPVIALLVALLALALASGCGSSSDETTGGSPAAGETAPASTSTTPQKPQAPVGVRATSCSASSTDGGEVRVTGVSCKVARTLVAGWYKDGECPGAPGASRTSCKLGDFTCLGISVGRGIAVTCAAPARSVAFVAKRPPT